MLKLKKFALKHPFLFGLVLIVVYSILGTLTYPVHFLFADNGVGQLYGDALAKFIIFLTFLLLLWRFGWLKAAGIASIGDARAWLIIAPILIYKVLAWLYAFTGDLSMSIPDAELAGGNFIYPLQTSLVEETMFRGLVLTAMMIAWGATKKGQVKAVLLSSIFFGILHMFNVLIRPVGIVLIQAIIVSLPGILYAATVLAFKSLWPAIIIHWMTNAAINIKLIGNEAYEETLTMWAISAALVIPLLVISVYWIWKLPDNYRYEHLDEPMLSA